MATQVMETHPSTVFNLTFSDPTNNFEQSLQINSSNMKLFIVLFALAAYAMAEAGPNLEARAGCSQKGQHCNGGTFLCCPGQGSCSGQVVSWPLLLFWEQIWSITIANS